MAISFNLRRVLDRKEWEMMTPCPSSTTTGSFTIADPTGLDKAIMFLYSASLIYRYDHHQDAWQVLPSSGIAGVFGAGSCGTFHHHGPSGTATAGTTTSITTNLTINRSIAGYKVRITGGTNAGIETTIKSNTLGANSVITFTDTLSVACNSTSVYLLLTGRYWFFNAGTSAVGLAYYDRALNTWTQRSVTGLPTAFGTEGRIVGTYSPSGTPFASGTATSATSTSLVNSSKAWTVDQWVNFQVRIIAGTGAGQVRTVADNDATSLVVAAWTTIPDATSQYVIEGNDDFLYLMGNGAVTLYRYSISGNAWTTLSPSTARSSAPGAGCSLNWAWNVSYDAWTSETAILNGRRLYSFRGAGTATLDYYDIPSNKWFNLAYTPQAEIFGTASCYAMDDDYILISKENTGRIFRYIIAENRLIPWSALIYPDSTAVSGDKMWTKTLTDGDTTIKWVYRMVHSSNLLFRCMEIDNDTNSKAGGWFIKEI